MYVHKKCALKGMDLDMDKRVAGFCGVCHQEGTVYHVEKTEDYYEQIVNSILFKVKDGVRVNTRAEVRARYKADLEADKARKDRDRFNESAPEWERTKEIAPFHDERYGENQTAPLERTSTESPSVPAETSPAEVEEEAESIPEEEPLEIKGDPEPLLEVEDTEETVIAEVPPEEPEEPSKPLAKMTKAELLEYAKSIENNDE